MGEIDPKAIERVSGPSWEALRPAFVKVADTLLAVAPSTGSQLTTIYVKFTIGREPSSPVFAVVWLKNSKRLVVGFSMPEGFQSDLLGDTPSGMNYKGLTHYLTIEPGDEIPDALHTWVKAAYENVSRRQAND
jgi:hypothetical protein